MQLRVNEEYAKRFEVRPGLLGAVQAGERRWVQCSEARAQGGLPGRPARPCSTHAAAQLACAPSNRLPAHLPARLQHNKKREELHRLQEKYPEQVGALGLRRLFVRWAGWFRRGVHASRRGQLPL